jgi:hypothetical protein
MSAVSLKFDDIAFADDQAALRRQTSQILDESD